LADDPKAITDKKGSSKKFSTRVAIVKADYVITRDAHIRSQGVDYRHKEIKAPKQEDIDKLEARVANGQQTVKSASSRGRLEIGKSFVDAAAACAEAGGDRDLFSSVGLTAQVVPNVQDCGFGLAGALPTRYHYGTTLAHGASSPVHPSAGATSAPCLSPAGYWLV
jgi:hypothetical protein